MKRFDEWFSSTGHWIYASRAEALATWMERGIEGLPEYQS